MRLLLVITLSFSIIFQNFHAQNVGNTIHQGDTIVNKENKENEPVYRRFRTSLNYSSANTLLGKRDSVAIPILTPTFKYTSSNDFFYQLSFVHSSTTNKLFDELDLKVGKNFYVGEKWNFTLSYARFIFSKDVDRLSAVVNNDFNAYAGFDWGSDIYTGLSMDYTTGKKTIRYETIDSIYAPKIKKYISYLDSGYTYIEAKDFTMTLMNSMTFYFYELFNENDKLLFTPEIDVVFGTQNGVESNSSTKKLAKGKGKYVKSTAETIKTNSPFLSYTLNLDFRYLVNRFTLNLSPYYTIPQNISAGAASKPYFVMYGGVIYTLKWERKKNK
jgi:hypothetical protein